MINLWYLQCISIVQIPVGKRFAWTVDITCSLGGSVLEHLTIMMQRSQVLFLDQTQIIQSFHSTMYMCLLNVITFFCNYVYVIGSITHFTR